MAGDSVGSDRPRRFLFIVTATTRRRELMSIASAHLERRSVKKSGVCERGEMQVFDFCFFTRMRSPMAGEPQYPRRQGAMRMKSK